MDEDEIFTMIRLRGLDVEELIKMDEGDLLIVLNENGIDYYEFQQAIYGQEK